MPQRKREWEGQMSFDFGGSERPQRPLPAVASRASIPGFNMGGGGTVIGADEVRSGLLPVQAPSRALATRPSGGFMSTGPAAAGAASAYTGPRQYAGPRAHATPRAGAATGGGTLPPPPSPVSSASTTGSPSSGATPSGGGGAGGALGVAMGVARWATRPGITNWDTAMQKHWSPESKLLVYGRGGGEPGIPTIRTYDEWRMPHKGTGARHATDYDYGSDSPTMAHPASGSVGSAGSPMSGPPTAPTMGSPSAGRPGTTTTTDWMHNQTTAGKGASPWFDQHTMATSGLNLRPPMSPGG